MALGGGGRKTFNGVKRSNNYDRVRHLIGVGINLHYMDFNPFVKGEI